MPAKAEIRFDSTETSLDWYDLPKNTTPQKRAELACGFLDGETKLDEIVPPPKPINLLRSFMQSMLHIR